MREVLSILFGAAFTIAVATALGSLLLSRLQVRLFRPEAVLIGVLAGAASLSFLTALLCVTHLARRGVFQWIGIAVLLLAWWTARGKPKRRELPAVPLRWWALFWNVFGVFAIYFFFTALAPE